MRRPRRTILGPLALAVVGAIGWFSVPTAAAAPDERPPVFEGRAAATAARVLVNTDPAALPVATLIDLQIPEASSVWDSSGTIEARASSVYPGATGTGGLQLLCDFSGRCPDGFPPDYPFTAFASFPAQPEARTSTGFARARAGRDGVSSDAELGNLADLSGLADLVTVGAARARTAQRFDDTGTLVIVAETAVTDVALAGGVVTIEQVAGVARARGGAAEDAASAEADASLTIAGVRTAGGDVLVGDEGITVAGHGSDGQVIEQLNAALEQALSGTGVSARILGIEADEGEGQRAGARSLGLRISGARAVDGPSLPEIDRLYRTYLAAAVLGEAGTTVFVSSDPFGIDVEIEAAPPPAGTTLPAGTDASAGSTSSGTVGRGGSAPLHSSAAPPAGDTSPVAPDVAPPHAAPQGPATAAVFELLEEPAALRQLYAILVAVAAVWLVGGRLITRRLADDR